MPKSSRVSWFRVFVACTCAALTTSCGGSSTSSSTPSPPSTSNTITITSSGISPKTLTVNAGSQVTFVNNDTKDHALASDPHPEHTDCPEIDIVFTSPGQSRQTSNLVTKRVCGIHDHLDGQNSTLKGTITIQ